MRAIIRIVYPELAKQNSWKLPVWYYISKSNMKSELAEEKAPHSYILKLSQNQQLNVIVLQLEKEQHGKYGHKKR